MREVRGNLWDAGADYFVITTNGALRKDGAAVMGRGVALQAMKRYPGLEYSLGRRIQLRGNHVSAIGRLISFPVKHHWREMADLKLIRRSAEELAVYVTGQRHLGYPIEQVAMPRPGCGNGRLDWKDVKPLIKDVLDDRFVVYNNE